MPRKRQPTAVIKANGRKHLSRTEENQRLDREIQTPETKQVRCPPWLPEEHRKEFLNLSRQLMALHIFCKLDRDTLGMYLVARQHWLDAGAHFEHAIAEGDTKAASSWSRTQHTAFSQCRACASDLGMTITSRCKLVVPKPDSEDEDDPMLKLLDFPAKEAERFG